MKNTILLIACISLFFSCKKEVNPYLNDPIPVHDSLKIDSKFVNEQRTINVWKPASYATSNDSLPVLYMPDGGIKEDFNHIANTLDTLIQQKKIPPYILVGIENTERGRDLTGASTVKEHEKYKIPMTDGAKDFRAFISEELIPEINKRYRTTAKKALIGESLAGLFVTETFFVQPSLFDVYIAFDPSLWWNNNYLVNNADSYFSNSNKAIRFWFAGSGTSDIFKHTNSLDRALKNSKPPHITWKYSPQPNEKHNTIFRATKKEALIWGLE